MFDWLFGLVVSFVTMVLGFFGIEWNTKKKVHFEDDVELSTTPMTPSAKVELPTEEVPSE
jgi:hypothetical protein